MAEHVEDALLFVKTTFQSYLTSRHKELAGRLAGQAVFDILGLVDAQRHFDLLLELSSSLIDAIAEVPPSASTVRDSEGHADKFFKLCVKRVVYVQIDNKRTIKMGRGRTGRHFGLLYEFT
eukprot:m.69607 g.69607  ORF g.69607 m.69607 type:complete len:121 (+) comp35619_c0_seq16:1915-2277(+)